MSNNTSLGRTALGIEFGSTRIKAVLLDANANYIANGSYTWESSIVDGFWSYNLDDAWTGVRTCVAQIIQAVKEKYHCEPNVSAICISAMMHGYLPFDRDGKQLVPFRTWKNTDTDEVAEQLSELFKFNIPNRWSLAHLESALEKNEDHVQYIDFLTTLSGYIHWQLTGRKVIGVGDASGMFPIGDDGSYDKRMVSLYDEKLSKRNAKWRIEDILPTVLKAGDFAGQLTEDGARLLDPSGTLKPGIAFCPPEGDAGTGMVSTNAITPGKGSVSAGTSIFAMVVLKERMKKWFREIDIVTTPDGVPVAMVHAACCTNEIDAWARLFRDFIVCTGRSITMEEIYSCLFKTALDGSADCGKLVVCNFTSDEPLMKLCGFPVVARPQTAPLRLGDFLRAQLYAAVAPLRIGMDILHEHADLEIEQLVGHGGFFKIPPAGQRVLAAAMDTAVENRESAGEGGPWGAALLSLYYLQKTETETLPEFIAKRIFSGVSNNVITATQEEIDGFSSYMRSYRLFVQKEREMTSWSLSGTGDSKS